MTVGQKSSNNINNSVLIVIKGSRVDKNPLIGLQSKAGNREHKPVLYHKHL